MNDPQAMYKRWFEGPGRFSSDSGRNSVRSCGIGSSGALTATPFVLNTGEEFAVEIVHLRRKTSLADPNLPVTVPNLHG